MATRIALLRHCTEDPAIGRFPSVRELVAWQEHEGRRALTKEGRRTAERLSETVSRLAPTDVWVSPLTRAAETAAPIARRLGLSPRTVPDLAEVSFGAPPGSGGLPGRVRVPRPASYVLMRSLWLLRMTRGVEGPAALEARVRRLASNLASSDGFPLVVSHGVVLVFLLSVLVHPERRARPRRGHQLRAGQLVVLDAVSSIPAPYGRWRITQRHPPP